MRRTFGGWLMRYCQDLSGNKTTSIRKLTEATGRTAPQAAEAVFLLALERNRIRDFLDRLGNGADSGSFPAVAELAQGFEGDAEAFLREQFDSLPTRFQKVLLAYDSIEAAKAADRTAVSQMAERTNEALERANVTRYRLCKELGLNEGNVYAWLAGDSAKVSRATARKAWRFAESLRT